MILNFGYAGASVVQVASRRAIPLADKELVNVLPRPYAVPPVSAITATRSGIRDWLMRPLMTGHKRTHRPQPALDRVLLPAIGLRVADDDVAASADRVRSKY
jgi:hypothetical protein